MAVLLETASQNKQSIDEISVGIREITFDVTELNKISSLNAENVRTLSHEIGKFKLQSGINLVAPRMTSPLVRDRKTSEDPSSLGRS